MKAAAVGGESNSAKSSLSLTSNSLPGIDLDAVAAMMQGGSSRGNLSKIICQFTMPMTS